MFRSDRLLYGAKEERGSELKGILKCIHSAAFWCLVFFWSLIIYSVSYLAALFVKNEHSKNKIYQKMAKLWGSVLADSALVKVTVSGLENIPADTAVIFTPNHQSFLDIFILLKILPSSFRFVIMRSLFKVPVIGPFIARAGFVSMDRKDRKRTISAIHRVIDLLKINESFVIFPEGKLTKDGTIGEFGRGTSIIIQRSKSPVVPIAIDGTFAALPKGAWRINPGNVTVKIGKPVHFENYHDEVNKSRSLELGSKLREIVVGLKG